MDNKVLTVLRTTVGVDEYPLFRAFIMAGVEFMNIDDRHYAWHQSPSPLYSVHRRLWRRRHEASFNGEIVKYLFALRPKLLLVFKGQSLSPEVIRTAKTIGTRTVIIYPDIDPSVHGKAYVEALGMADVLYHTKPNMIEYYKRNINHRAKCIGPIYDASQVTTIGEIDNDVGVSFVGHHSPGKELYLTKIASKYSGRISVYGDRWSAKMFKSASSEVNVRSAIYGSAVNELYRHSLCVIGLLMEPVSSLDVGDEITSRTVLVPAYGGLLMHQLNGTSKRLFESVPEVLFDSPEEMCDKIQYILNKPEERETIWRKQQEVVLKYGTEANELVNQLLSGKL